ncbi:MAG: CCDC90 family protein [Desulfovibrio sp.]|nr:CCDC90 family protein [Desulfovibrio sp.]
MVATTFDTLGYCEKLIAAGVSEQQAKVQADTMREVIEDRLAYIDGNLATKGDIQTVKADYKLKRALPGYSWYRLLPDGMIPIDNESIVLQEVYGFQNLVAILN